MTAARYVPTLRLALDDPSPTAALRRRVVWRRADGADGAWRRIIGGVAASATTPGLSRCPPSAPRLLRSTVGGLPIRSGGPFLRPLFARRRTRLGERRPRRPRLHGADDGQRPQGERDLPMPTGLRPNLVPVEAAVPFAGLEAPFDRPPIAGNGDQLLERRLRRPAAR
jgi:hypothetical protein